MEMLINSVNYACKNHYFYFILLPFPTQEGFSSWQEITDSSGLSAQLSSLFQGMRIYATQS